MAVVPKIDSNVVGTRWTEEDSFGVVSGDETWTPLEPNSFGDFGGKIVTTARKPINPSRQRKKGVTTDLDASGGFNTDLTQTNMQKFLQGLFYADLRTKAELAIPTVDTGDTTDDYEPTSGGTAFKVGDLLFAKGFSATGNNGLKKVTGTVTATSVPVTTPLSAAAAQTGTISRVGFEFNSGDAQIDVVAGPLPRLKATAKNLTELGLIPGELIFIGGDAAGEKFANAVNNGLARVRSVAAGFIELDKTAGTMIADTGAAKTIRVFVGRVLKNETGSLIKRRTYQIERTLGAPDDASPSQIQSEYITGVVQNEMTLNIPKADKLNLDISLVAKDTETRTGVVGVKAGTRPAIEEADAFNTSSDFSRIKLAVFVNGTTNATPLFAYVEDLKLTVKNNVSPLKAIGVLGAFDHAAGTFEVSGTASAFFSDVAAMAAVRNNSDVTLDFFVVRNNSGFAMDLPMCNLGDGRPTVKSDEPILVPLAIEAATGAKIDVNLDHTLLMVFFDYLPNAADV